MATLAKELEAFRASLMHRIGRDTEATFASVEAQLLASDAGQMAPREGAVASDFSLLEANGSPWRLYSLLDEGPVVLVFYRGGWCPFCTISLRALQREMPRLRGLRARVLGISPELPVHMRATADRNGLDFPLLHDANNAVAGEWHLTHELRADVQPIYTRFGHDIPGVNGTGNWRLPFPAGFVIAPDRRIVLAKVDPRVYVRMEPADAVAAVASLAATQDSPVC